MNLRSRLRVHAVVALAAALGMANSAQASFYQCDSKSRVIRVTDGESEHTRIEEDDLVRLKEALASCAPRGYGGPVVIDLFSGGGSVTGALEVSQYLIGLTNPVWTRVSKGAYCISACTYMFLAGSVREVAAGGSFEPHGFSSWRNGPARKLALLSEVSGELAALGPKFMWFQGFFDAADQQSRAFADGLRRRYASFTDEDWEEQRQIKLGLLLVPAYKELLSERRALMTRLIDILETSMAELERESALNRFRDRALARDDIEQRYTDWVADAFLRVLNAYSSDAGTAKIRPAQLDDIRQKIFVRQRGVSAHTAETVANQLSPYLGSRTDINKDALVNLMFSTSIIYMRPLTSEELCDYNIVNKNCEN